jgi:hypothetical protein
MAVMLLEGVALLGIIGAEDAEHPVLGIYRTKLAG